MSSRIAILLYVLPGIALTLSLMLFLLYVPMMSIVTVVAILLALGLMFALGVFTGVHRLRVARWIRRLPNAR